MIAVIVGLVLGACVFALSAWTAFPTARSIRNRGERFARDHQTFVSSEFVTDFDRTTVQTRRWAGTSLLVGMSVLLVLAFQADFEENVGLEFLPIMAVLGGTLAGLRVRTAGREFPVPPGRSVIARPRMVVVSDYVPPSVRGLSWLTVVVSLALAFLAIRDPEDAIYSANGLVPVAAGVVLAVAVLTEFVARVTCARPQSAVDPCHLYVQDAWRSEFLLGSYRLVSGSAFMLMLGAMSFGALGKPLYVLGLVAYVAQPIAVLAQRLTYRRRLWPTLLPGQILYPGQPVPTREQATA